VHVVLLGLGKDRTFRRPGNVDDSLGSSSAGSNRGSSQRLESELAAMAKHPGRHEPPFMPILLQKYFSVGRLKFLEPLMRPLPCDVRDPITRPLLTPWVPAKPDY
jgi:hypothetical protein